MNNEFTNRDPAESTSRQKQPLPVSDLNPYLSPQADLTTPLTTYQANTANDFATAALIVVLNLIGAVLMVPFVIIFANATPQSVRFPWFFWLAIQLLSYGFMAAITVPIGVWLGTRVGLDAPVFRGIAKGDFSVLNPIRVGWMAAMAVGVAVGTLVFFVDKMLPPEVSGAGMNQEAIKTIEAAPAWIRLIAAFGTGITEETWCRYGFLAFIVWAGAALTGSERPSAVYFWVANVLASLPFAVMYIFNLLFLGGTATPESVAYLVGFNSLVALTCGWLYWKYGIESAMASHTIGDVVMRVALPFIAQMVT